MADTSATATADPAPAQAGPQSIPVVYPVTNATVASPAGAGTVLVALFSHWWRDDPVVAANPQLFSEDPRWGMRFTQEPPGYAPDGTGMAPTLDGSTPDVHRPGVAPTSQPTRGHRHQGVRGAR